MAFGIASGLVTAAAVKTTDIVNERGRQVGISASRGTKYLGLTWSATALMLLTTLMWLTMCCCFASRDANARAYKQKLQGGSGRSGKSRINSWMLRRRGRKEYPDVNYSEAGNPGTAHA